MFEPAGQARSVSFGPFEVSFPSRELRKHGMRVGLPGQPFDILAILLEHADEVVTREELRQRLWPADTFVDFEHGMNNAVKKLRLALGDSADHPLYVETIARLGYRFIAPLDRRESASNKSLPPHAPRRLRFIWKPIVAAIVLAAIFAGGYLYLHRTKKLTEQDTIVLADFANATNDAVFDGTLREGLSVQLEQSPFLSLVSDDQIQQTLKMMGQKPDVQLTPTIAREICQRAGSTALLDGSIAQIGTPYLLTVRAVDCSNGETLASAEAQASDKNDVLDALGKIASHIRNKLGESLSTVQKFDMPLEQATTPSLEALEAFSRGRRVHFTGTGFAASIPFFEHAVELDPNFALAYASLGRSYGDIGEPDMAARYTRKAYELRNRTSGAERYFISASFHLEVTGNMENAQQTCELWIEAYPRAELPHVWLSALILPVFGRYEEAVEEARETIRVNPDFPLAYFPLMFNYIALNRLDEAKAAHEQALKRKFDIAFYSPPLYQIAFLQNDTPGLAQQVASSAGQSGIEDEMLGLEAETAAYSGWLRDAREFSRRAMDSAERAGEKETIATYSAMSALREALFGNSDEARRSATFAIVRSTGLDVQYSASLALAHAGDEERAQELTRNLGKRFPENTLWLFSYLPTLRATLGSPAGSYLAWNSFLAASIASSCN